LKPPGCFSADNYSCRAKHCNLPKAARPNSQLHVLLSTGSEQENRCTLVVSLSLCSLVYCHLSPPWGFQMQQSDPPATDAEPSESVARVPKTTLVHVPAVSASVRNALPAPLAVPAGRGRRLLIARPAQLSPLLMSPRLGTGLFRETVTISPWIRL
jgi:hypothetical protein